MATVTEIPLPNVELIESDGEPLETLWHLAAISLLMDSIHFHLRDRTNYFVGGNMFFYFSQTQARNRDYRGPDFFYVDEVDGRRRRDYWAVWDEDGRYPDVIVELLSPSTAVVDRTVKKELYERTFRTPEYFCYDPATETFEGWRLGRHGRYEAIVADERGWLHRREHEGRVADRNRGRALWHDGRTYAQERRWQGLGHRRPFRRDQRGPRRLRAAPSREQG